jgi:hypothetical protein
MPPLIPVVVCLALGCLLVLLSYAAGIASFQDPTTGKQLGWSYEPNWWSTFVFWIPMALYFCCSVINSIPQVISKLVTNHMVRDTAGDLVSNDALVADWRLYAGWAVRIAVSFSAVGFLVSWIEWYKYCLIPSLHPGQIVHFVHGWTLANTLDPTDTNGAYVASFGFLAFSAQGGAITCFLFYILILMAFATWIFMTTNDGNKFVLRPNLRSDDPRRGFEKFEPFIENVLFASMALFFQFFITRIQFVFLDDAKSKTIFEFLGRNLTLGFGSDTATLAQRGAELFDFGGTLHFANTMMIVATLVTVLTAFLVPTVIVKSAAGRSKDLAEDELENDHSLAEDLYDLPFPEAWVRVKTMVIWPLKYAKPLQWVLLVAFAASCYVFYKLILFLLGFIIFTVLYQTLTKLKGGNR